jgi:hypothetical protein
MCLGSNRWRERDQNKIRCFDHWHPRDLIIGMTEVIIFRKRFVVSAVFVYLTTRFLFTWNITHQRIGLEQMTLWALQRRIYYV